MKATQIGDREHGVHYYGDISLHFEGSGVYARYLTTYRLVVHKLAGRQFIFLHYGQPAMEGPRHSGQATLVLAIGNPLSHGRLLGGLPSWLSILGSLPIQLSPLEGCRLEDLGNSGPPEYCLYSTWRPAKRKVRNWQVADLMNQILKSSEEFLSRRSLPSTHIT